MEHKQFAERLNCAMYHQHLKQVDIIRMAEAAGVKLGKGQMSQYVSGRALPRKTVAQFLASVLEVSEEWLCTGEGADREQEEKAEQERMEEEIRMVQTKKEEAVMKEIKKSSKLDHVLYDV